MSYTKVMNEQQCEASSANDIAMKIVGDFWTLRIVDSLQEVELRFCQMERAIPEISPATLTSRLKKLEDSKIVERFVEVQDKQSVSYGLTPKGRALLPVLDAVKQFTMEYGS